MANEGGLPELLDALRWRWHVAVLVALGVFLGAFIYVQSLPSEYTGRAVVAISPRPVEEGAVPSAEVLRIVAPKYVEYITAPQTIDYVAESLDVKGSDLDDGLDAQIASETGNLTITVQTDDPDLSSDAANEFAEAAVNRSKGFVIENGELVTVDRDELLKAEVVAAAVPSDSPSGPPRRLLQAAALLVGLLLGIAVAFLVERGRPRLRSWRDIARLTGYPVLGRVPRSRKLAKQPWHAFADPIIGASFRSLRTNLESRLAEPSANIVVVTSPTKGDGKTTVAALFAEALARLGLKVLLIDADLRRPGVSRTFKLNSTPGVSEVLRGEVELDDAIQEGWTANLAVLPTKVDADAGDLLARSFSDIIRDARQRYEVIVADTAPLIGTDDARTLATMASGVLLVVSARSLAEIANEAVLSLETLKAPVLGVVANRVRESSRSYQYG